MPNISNISLSADTLIFVLIFAAFLIIGYKVLSILKNTVIAASLGAAFPFAMNALFGTHLQTSFLSELYYMGAAAGIYLAYEALVLLLGTGSFFWSAIKLASAPFVWLGSLAKRLIRSGNGCNEGCNEKRSDEKEK